MRFLRRSLFFLTLALALVAILALAAFLPRVQTLIAGMMLPDEPGRQVTLGSLSAGLSGVEVTDLRVEVDGAVLTLPSLTAKLPLKTAGWDRKLVIRSLVAKGWTLDLTRQSISAGGTATASVVTTRDDNRGGPATSVASAERVARVFRGILGDGRFPCDTSLDGVVLDGDVLVAVPAEPEPVRVHMNLTGGGLAAGHDGDFAIEVTGKVADPSLPFHAAMASGHLKVTMGTPQTINRVELQAALSAEGGALPGNLALAASVARPGGVGKETYRVDLSRGARHLATVLANHPSAAGGFDGTWSVDLRDSDVTGLFPDHPFPAIATAGEGRFDADGDFARVHATGRLNSAAGRLGVVAPVLARVGDVTVVADFDLSRSGRSVRFDRLSVAVAGRRPIAAVKSLQPFTFDEKTSGLTPGDSNADWFEGSVQGLPLGWFAGMVDGITLVGNDATGEFLVRPTAEGVAVVSKTPLAATAVAIKCGDRALGQGLDLSLPLTAEFSPKGWQMQATPLTLGVDGQRLATIEAKASGTAESDGKIQVSGTWHADLAALETRRVIPGVSGIKGQSASGDFTAKFGSATEVEGKLSVVGHDAGHVLTASVNGYVGARGSAALRIPVRIALGSKVAEFTAEGRSNAGKDGTRFDVDLSGVKVALEPVGFLLGCLPVVDGVLRPALTADAALVHVGARDERPFWGNASGRVGVDFYQLSLGSRELDEVAGTFEIEHGAIRLKGGRGKIPAPIPAATERRNSFGSRRSEVAPSVVTADGAVTFDAAAEIPYSVKATATLDTIDAARLFGARGSGDDPLVEGRFAVAGTLACDGKNLTDLIRRRREEYRFTSTAGIIRFLKTSVADSITEPPSKSAGALVAVSSAVGAVLGIKGHTLYSGENKLAPNTEAVLDFTSEIGEIGFDKASVTVVRDADRTIHLTEIALSGPNASLSGSGEIGYAEDVPLAGRPLSLDLRLGARGGMAGLLSNAGLLAPGKDEQGYSLLNQTIHLGGTLRDFDVSQWHDLLLKAANAAPASAGPKKGG